MTTNTPQKLRIKSVLERYNLKAPSTIYRWIKSEGFPPPIKLSPSCSVWDLEKIEAWEESRPQMQGAH
ncbi:AlpA family phage regulatory protein [Thiomicrorhabdus sp. 6S2-11]|uniref:AlpA family phage regulatory protein n=1 Tax=Thiomicrorhabdus marina TaxID=2818442 RepID=A0ABS3Q7J5_9GAMM|nr:AlpA family phage regulatory protein [Thiomicrorhabdus marina]MBO1928304.1 AlpA family phage regulatory protein [Thiomicrorhabdus marina]